MAVISELGRAAKRTAFGLCAALVLAGIPGIADAQDDTSFVGAHGLELPATFTGVLPCADCEGLSYHLDMWPDGAFHMRLVYMNGDESLTEDTLGRWRADPARGAIALHDGSEMPTRWEVENPAALRLLARDGSRVESELNYSIVSDGTLSQTDIDNVHLAGSMTYMADAATFRECATGRTYPMLQEGAYINAERAYRENRVSIGAPLLMQLDGGIGLAPAMEGEDRMTVTVERFVRAQPGLDCSPAGAPSFENTYWRFDTLLGDDVVGEPKASEPHLVLLARELPQYSATVGCNRIAGVYRQNADALAFEPGAMTRMACPPALDALEQSLTSVLQSTQSFRMESEDTMVLLNADGDVVADLTAVYYR